MQLRQMQLRTPKVVKSTCCVRISCCSHNGNRLNELAVDLPNVRGTAIADPWDVAGGAAGEVANGLSGSFD
jgi:hypothetical protein